MEKTARVEIQEEANASIGNEHQDSVLANDITKMLESLEPPLSPKCCIYRVPHDIRKLNKEAYTPQFISIGPFHHGNKKLQTMERLKLRYFKRFVKKVAPTMKELVSIIRDKEGDVRRCYAETIQLSSNDCVKMILVDASFIIVLFQHQWWSHDDLIVLIPRLVTNIIHDLWLLENQLPFFVIEELYNFACPSHPNNLSLPQLTFQFFAHYNPQNMPHDPNMEIKHFVDLLRTFFLPPSQRLRQINRGEKVAQLYTASQLHEAGVKLKMVSRKCLFDLKFTNGELEIPCLKFFDQTESFFRNLVALEQCLYLDNGYVTDYIEVLDILIDTAKDVDLLVQKEILDNSLGDSNAVTTLVNNLCKRTLVAKTNSDYCRLCEDLNSFYNKRWHRWKAILSRDYFSSPWRIASTVAAIILLVLTFTQTVCSIISLL